MVQAEDLLEIDLGGPGEVRDFAFGLLFYLGLIETPHRMPGIERDV